MLPAVHRSRPAHRPPSGLRLAGTTPVPESRLDRVRGAGAAFVRGTTLGWGRRDLAEWLVCQYSPCAAAPNHRERAYTAPSPAQPVDDVVVEPIILEARARTLRLLGDLVVPWQASPIARLAVAAGIVVSQHDARGGVAYSPVALERMRLADRVASLFVADYLNRPTDYRWLVMCRECGELSFATELAHSAWCEASPDSWVPFTAAEAIATAAGA